MDAAIEFAKFAFQTTYSDLPKNLIELLKDDILDTIGNMLAGSADPLMKKIIPIMTKHAGPMDASVFGLNRKISVEDAAFLNACMCFALDYDDMHEPARLHFGCAAIPVALAVSEWLGNVTGKDFLTALAVSLEIGARLGTHMIRRNPTQVMGGWDYAALHGYITTAVLAAKLMELNEEQILNAMGIAFHQCSGTSISAMDNAHTKIMGPGFAARGGILAAKFAAVGVTGAHSLFTETEISMAHQYHNGCDETMLTSHLGTRWDALNLGFKAYPCCRLIHRHIDAALQISDNPAFDWEQIDHIHLTSCSMIAPMTAPTAQNCSPGTRLHAQFSIPWTVACALVLKRVAIDEFSDDALRDNRIIDVASKIESAVDPTLTDLDAPACIVVTLKNGETFRAHTGKPLGSHENPLSRNKLETKFYDCAAHCIFPLVKGNVSFIPETLLHFNDIENITDFIAQLHTLCSSDNISQ